MPANTILGSHTASKGLILPLIAKVVDIVRNNIYAKLRAIPTPICKPIPPLTLRDARERPIIDRIKAEKADAVLRYFSITNSSDRKSTRLNSSHVKISYAV